ncbi:MAG: class I SAM-dependent methyltransferase [Methylocella sp.]
MKASARRDAANAVMLLDSVTVGDLELRAYGWLLPYKERSVSGFEVIVDGHSAPAVWHKHDSPDVAQVMRNVPGSERARFDLRADFRANRRRNSTGMVRATLDDGSQTFAMFPIASDIPTPDERMAGMVGGHFTQIGFAFLAPLIQFGGLRQDAAVLDAGCGCGRIAYGLAHYLSQQGSYVGFDIMRGHIEWARDVMARDLPKFTFIHADITNQQYNPTGAIRSIDYRFPCDENSVDLCIATSLYTHMLKEDSFHYIKETARVLKKGSRSFITAFIMTDEAKRSVASGFALQDIRHAIDQEGILTARPDMPEAVIGIEEQMLFSWVADAGLEVELFYPGWWAHENSPTHQDILVLRKK